MYYTASVMFNNPGKYDILEDSIASFYFTTVKGMFTRSRVGKEMTT